MWQRSLGTAGHGSLLEGQSQALVGALLRVCRSTVCTGLSQEASLLPPSSAWSLCPLPACLTLAGFEMPPSKHDDPPHCPQVTKRATWAHERCLPVPAWAEQVTKTREGLTQLRNHPLCWGKKKKKTFQFSKCSDPSVKNKGEGSGLGQGRRVRATALGPPAGTLQSLQQEEVLVKPEEEAGGVR